jgi:RNA polymerase sigma factor (sigma-70 family)
MQVASDASLSVATRQQPLCVGFLYESIGVAHPCFPRKCRLMDTPSAGKKKWVLDEYAFNQLLWSLAADRTQAAAQYENIRQKLITFFRCHACAFPEDCADMAMDRVARKISEGIELNPGNPFGFFFGIAHNILYEYRAQQARLPIDSASNSSIECFPQNSHETRQPEEAIDQQIHCLEHCLEELTPVNRRLILEYYQGRTAVKIKNREKLAKQLGIPINALRIRALRVRKKLKDCIGHCLKQSLDA